MSLVPLEFRPLPWEEALVRMRTIPFLELGLYRRADWVANGVVFAPIGFFWCAALSENSRLHPFAAALVVMTIAAVGAIALEYTQVFFARRTTSLNDIYAEVLGAGFGASAWVIFAKPSMRLIEAFSHSFVPAARAVLILYAILYLALNWFPYDFLVSFDELSARLARHPVTFFPPQCEQPRCGINLVVEIVAAIPVGLILLLIPWSARPSHLKIFVLGAGFGFVIEFVQLLTVSGSVQGLSLITRGLGLVLGRMLAERLSAAGWQGLRAVLRPAVIWMVPPYLLALMVGNHWEWNTPIGFAAALEEMRSLRWTPFYYFYEAPEVFAVQKLAYQSVMYAPVGVLYWAYCYDRPGALRRAWIPVGIAVILTAIMGFGRIMLYRRVGPDPTNLLIAALAAYLAFTATQFLGGLAAGSPRTFDRATPAAAPLPGLLSRRALATVLTLVTIVATASYPFGAAGNLTLGLALPITHKSQSA